uniref:U14-Saltitoxin-Pre1a_1 n=1 Tax=Phidippus regius TaxID=1905328 RepID=A0A482Z6R6_9ARAC
MKRSIFCITIFLILTVLTCGDETKEIVQEHHIQKRSCNSLGEECTKDIDCCSVQCVCASYDCKCGRRPRPSQLRKYFAKRTCGT